MDEHFERAKKLARLLDERFEFVGFKFGLDPIISLVPGIGDFVGAMLSSYLVWIGIKAGVPKEILGKMILNIIFDYLVGVIPLLGDLGDFFIKPNIKNIKLLEKYIPKVAEEGEVVD